MNETARIFVPITKIAKTADGARIITGVMTSEALDLDGQIADYDWAKKEATSWFKDWGNVREMHENKAVGKGIDIQFDDAARSITLTSKVVDPLACTKIDEGILKGYSFGAKSVPGNPVKVIKDPQAPSGRIVGGKIVETTLADHPANEDCIFAIAKMAGGKAEVTKGLLAEAISQDDLTKLADPADKTVTPDISKKKYSTDQRKALAAKGQALKDLSYPIADKEDLKNAITLAQSGHGDVAAAKALIKRRARALGATELLPDDWKAVKPDVAKAVSLPNGEAQHNDAINQAIAATRQLIQQEAAEDDDCDAYGIQCLTNVLAALQDFVYEEVSEARAAAYDLVTDYVIQCAAMPDLQKRRVFYTGESRQKVQGLLDQLQAELAGMAGNGPESANTDDADVAEHKTDQDDELKGGDSGAAAVVGAMTPRAGATQAGPNVDGRADSNGKTAKPDASKAAANPPAGNTHDHDHQHMGAAPEDAHTHGHAHQHDTPLDHFPHDHDHADTGKAAGSDLSKAVTPDAIKAAMADVLKEHLSPLKEDVAKTTAGLESLKKDVDEMGRRAAPGGPFVGPSRTVEKTFPVNETIANGVKDDQELALIGKIERMVKLSQSENHEVAASASEWLKANVTQLAKTA